MLGLPPCWHSLESPVGVLHDNCTGMAQDKARNPALGCGALVSGGSEHQKHVLLVTGQNLNDLSLIDVYLILLHCRVLVCHQHGGDVATAATFTLEGKMKKTGWTGTETRSDNNSHWLPCAMALATEGSADRQGDVKLFLHTLFSLMPPLATTWSASAKQFQQIHLSADAPEA